EEDGEGDHEASLYKVEPCTVPLKGGGDSSDKSMMVQKLRRMTDRTEDTASISSINRGMSRDSFPSGCGYPADTDGAATDDAADSDCPILTHRGLGESNSLGQETAPKMTAVTAAVMDVDVEGALGAPLGAAPGVPHGDPPGPPLGDPLGGPPGVAAAAMVGSEGAPGAAPRATP
ncbi:unnamed protein product, partial [Laminaria digitata]